MSALDRSIVGERKLRPVADGFARVLIAAPEVPSSAAQGRRTAADPAIEVEFAGKVRVRILGSVSTELAAVVIKIRISTSTTRSSTWVLWAPMRPLGITTSWPWLLVAGLGAYHGLNPAMGWMFAVGLGLHA
jgi:hypothetical protein